MYEHIWMDVTHEMTQVKGEDFDLAPHTWLGTYACRENQFGIQSASKNDWNDRHWMNTPGTIYSTQSDNCGTGMVEAPGNVRYYESGYEVIYRQPLNKTELVQVISAAICDPFRSYGVDGDTHWNRKNLRGWWAQRDKLKAEIKRLKATETVMEPQEYDGWLAYLDGDCLLFLRLYAFFLENKRALRSDEFLPEL